MSHQLLASQLNKYISIALMFSPYEETTLDQTEFKLAPSTREKMTTDLSKFMLIVAEDPLLCGHHEILSGSLPQDFWLARHDQGVGFHGGNYHETGERLTAISQSFPTQILYVCGDGLIYIN